MNDWNASRLKYRYMSVRIFDSQVMKPGEEERPENGEGKAQNNKEKRGERGIRPRGLVDSKDFDTYRNLCPRMETRTAY